MALTGPLSSGEPAGALPATPLGEVLRLLDQITKARSEVVRLAEACLSIQDKMRSKLEWLRHKIFTLRTAYYHDIGHALRQGTWSKRDREALIGITDYLAADLNRESPSEKLSSTDKSEEEARSDRRSETRQESGSPASQAGDGKGWNGEIRALYLLLARGLHPDKEPEPQLRVTKTEWMQKVTSAYREKNLGAMLDILVQNPLNAVGSSLQAAPYKTLRGFARRLKREWKSTQTAVPAELRTFDPRLVDLARNTLRNQQAWRHWETEVEKSLDLYKERSRIFKEEEGIRFLIRMSRSHPLEELV